ncbi:hypothetical protein MHYP_G00256350 [Metynnis hypsauchen]
MNRFGWLTDKNDSFVSRTLELQASRRSVSRVWGKGVGLGAAVAKCPTNLERKANLRRRKTLQPDSLRGMKNETSKKTGAHADNKSAHSRQVDRHHELAFTGSQKGNNEDITHQVCPSASLASIVCAVGLAGAS